MKAARHEREAAQMQQAVGKSTVETLQEQAEKVWSHLTVAVPGVDDLYVINWRNHRLRWREEAPLTPAQRRELLRRDGYHCSVPGCTHSLWLDGHHVIYYCRGGPTLPGNLIILCSTCHRNVHKGYLRISGIAPHGLTFTDSDGRSIVRDYLSPLASEVYDREFSELDDPDWFDDPPEEDEENAA